MKRLVIALVLLFTLSACATTDYVTLSGEFSQCLDGDLQLRVKTYSHEGDEHIGDVIVENYEGCAFSDPALRIDGSQ